MLTDEQLLGGFAGGSYRLGACTGGHIQDTVRKIADVQALYQALRGEGKVPDSIRESVGLKMNSVGSLNIPNYIYNLGNEEINGHAKVVYGELVKARESGELTQMQKIVAKDCIVNYYRVLETSGNVYTGINTITGAKRVLHYFGNGEILPGMVVSVHKRDIVERVDHKPDYARREDNLRIVLNKIDEL
jgi:hypothetical protein